MANKNNSPFEKFIKAQREYLKANGWVVVYEKDHKWTTWRVPVFKNEDGKPYKYINFCFPGDVINQESAIETQLCFDAKDF